MRFNNPIILVLWVAGIVNIFVWSIIMLVKLENEYSQNRKIVEQPILTNLTFKASETLLPHQLNTVWYNQEIEKLIENEREKQKFLPDYVIRYAPEDLHPRMWFVIGEDKMELGMRSDGVVVWREYKEKK